MNAFTSMLLLIAVALLPKTYGQRSADIRGAFSPTYFPRNILWLWVDLAELDLAIELARPQETDKPRITRAMIIAMATVVFPLVNDSIASFSVG